MTFVQARLKFCAAALLCAVLAVATGCAPPVQMEATTTIQADGSWTRALAFGVPVGDGRAAARLTPAARRQQTAASRRAAFDRLRATFALPSGLASAPRAAATAAATDAARHQRADPGFVRYVTRCAVPLAPGDTLRGDVSLLRPATAGSRAAAAAAPVVVNEALVRPRGPGRIEYRETLRWRGPLPAQLLRPDPALDAALAAHLPPAAALAPGANDPAHVAVRRRVALRVQRRLWRVYFGPGENGRPPVLFAPAASNEDYLIQQTRAALDDALDAEFFDHLFASERREAAQNVARALFAPTLTPAVGKGSSGGASAQNSDGGVAPWATLTFTLKPPGRVLETNGRYDARAGTVTWTMNAAAPAAGNVVLSAVCEAPRFGSGPRTVVAAAPAVR